MPQLDLRYSDDLNHIAFESLFRQIEAVINEIDDSAGACKSRAYPTDSYLHTHVYLCMKLLKKEYRDAAFMKKCRDAIEVLLKQVLPKNCFYAIELNFSGEYYLTSMT
jgi:hypothetical protein